MNTSLGSGEKIIDVTQGATIAIIRTSTGRSLAWGDTRHGAFGFLDTTLKNFSIPLEIMTPGEQLSVISIYSGILPPSGYMAQSMIFATDGCSYTSNITLLSNNTITCNVANQVLGFGIIHGYNPPKPLPTDIDYGNQIIVDVQTGQGEAAVPTGTTIALTNTGRLYTWGRNFYGTIISI